MTSSEIYLAAIGRVSSRCASWSADDAATIIPTCPGWSAHDLVAHLAGGAADHAAGRLDGFPGPAWTSRHVDERSFRPTRDVLAELLALAAETATRCDERPAGPNSSWDAYIHERDLAAACDGEDPPLDGHGLALFDDIMAFVAGNVAFEIAVERGGAVVRVAVVGEQRWVATVAAPAAFRVLTGRGAPGEMRTWGWSPAPPPSTVLDELSLF